MRVGIVGTMGEEIWLRRKARLREETLAEMKFSIWRIREEAWLRNQTWVWWENRLGGQGGCGVW